MSIVEFAAWVIVGQAVGKFVFSSFKEKRQRIEHGAVKAEYEALEDAQYSIPEDEPEWKRTRIVERYRQRQQQLLMRYPNVLVRTPDLKYFREAEEEDKDTHPSFINNLKKNGRWYAGSAALTVVWIVVWHFLWSGIKDFISNFFAR